jgi:hypothetical protein
MVCFGSGLHRRALHGCAALGLLAATQVAAQDGGPGTLDVDLEAAERALERTLVVEGPLLLPPGRIEIEPSFNYQFSDRTDEVAGFVDGDRVLDDQSLQEDRLTFALEARIGLPRDAQLELRVPLAYANRDVEDAVIPFNEEFDVTGIGDVEIGIARTLLRERGAVPDTVGRLTWNTDTGEDDDGFDLGSGFHEIEAAVTGLWRLDPLAITAGLSYERALEDDGVRPGDVVAVSFSTLLAASPTAAFGVNFTTAFEGETEIDGDGIDGSDENRATIGVILSTIVGRNTLLNVNVGAGLTEDSPDYFISVTAPIRF